MVKQVTHGPFEVAAKLMGREVANMSIDDALNLFFMDSDMVPLMVLLLLLFAFAFFFCYTVTLLHCSPSTHPPLCSPSGARELLRGAAIQRAEGGRAGADGGTSFAFSLSASLRSLC